MLVQDFLHNSAQRLPDKVALICGRQRLSYSKIDEMADRLANALIEQGLQRGGRVAIYLKNSVESAVSIFAALKAGGVFVVINPTTKFGKMAHLLNNCRASALLTEAKKADLADQVMSNVPTLKFSILCGDPPSKIVSRKDYLYFDAVQAHYPARRPSQVSIDLDLACLIYTSGSTGDPKGVMCDHSNVVFAASAIIDYLENDEDDVVINVLPFSFDYGLYQLLMVFKFGGTLVLEPSFAFPASILHRIQEEHVTGLPGVPTIFSMLLRMDLSPYDLSSLRYVTNTAAALAPSHIQDLRRKLPGVTVYSMYGLTETKRTLYLPPDQLDCRPDSVGIAIPGTEVWIEDEKGNRLGPGKIGELVVRGRHVMRGYWENPEATAKRYRPGPQPGERVCYTDDLFRMDEEGYIYFVGRKDDIIKCRGEKVAPKEVENVLYSFPGVIEAAVIGVPDPIMGEAVKAFVVDDNGGANEAKILAHCRFHLEDFMVPKYIEIRDELPKTTSNKIKKTTLE
jgi:amino acid adenylation domain-containing protein